MQTTGFGRLLRIVSVLALVAACQSDMRLVAFASDGCVGYASSLRASQPGLPAKAGEETGSDWCDCCVEHDIAYWRGGTVAQRDQADARLRDCVARKTNNRDLADTLYTDLRTGKSTHFFEGYRWAYGWEGERQYRALNEKEQLMANRLLLDYFRTGKSICL